MAVTMAVTMISCLVSRVPSFSWRRWERLRWAYLRLLHLQCVSHALVLNRGPGLYLIIAGIAMGTVEGHHDHLTEQGNLGQQYPCGTLQATCTSQL